MKVRFSDRGFRPAQERLERAGLDVVRGAAAEMQSSAQARVRVDQGHLRRSIQLAVHPGGATVFSDSEVAVFHEYGTGVYAESGGGRSDAWVYFNESAGHFVTTRGLTPNPAFRPAFDEAINYFHKAKRRKGL